MKYKSNHIYCRYIFSFMNIMCISKALFHRCRKGHCLRNGISVHHKAKLFKYTEEENIHFFCHNIMVKGISLDYCNIVVNLESHRMEVLKQRAPLFDIIRTRDFLQMIDDSLFFCNAYVRCGACFIPSLGLVHRLSMASKNTFYQLLDI